MTTPGTVLDFWFARESRARWFVRDDAFDHRVGVRLGGAFEQAASGALDGWQETPAGCLALILLLDQVPRNLFRGTPRAFATDGQALALAHAAIDRALDLGFRSDRRLFIYLPFEHSESLADQQTSVFLIRTRIGKLGYLDYAERHLRIIERFGRFPHRNACLGRDSTPEELAFLSEPGSSF